LSIRLWFRTFFSFSWKVSDEKSDALFVSKFIWGKWKWLKKLECPAVKYCLDDLISNDQRRSLGSAYEAIKSFSTFIQFIGVEWNFFFMILSCYINFFHYQINPVFKMTQSLKCISCRSSFFLSFTQSKLQTISIKLSQLLASFSSFHVSFFVILTNLKILFNAET
jgi:hypothetical protein